MATSDVLLSFLTTEVRVSQANLKINNALIHIANPEGKIGENSKIEQDNRKIVMFSRYLLSANPDMETTSRLSRATTICFQL